MGNRDKVRLAPDIAAAILERIAHGEIVLQCAGIVREVARKFEGRRADKRFRNAVAERAEAIMGAGWSVFWKTDSFSSAVELWTRRDGMLGAPGYEARLSFTVARHMAHEARDTINEAWIVEYNAGYFLEAEQLPALRRALDEGKPAAWAAQIAEIARLRKALGEDAAAFGCNYIIEI